jgi:multidrug resistance protein MdtO
MLTCIIVAVPGLGSSVVKGALRIGGCLIGSFLALLAFVYVMPHLDSLTGLLLMILPVVAVSAWITAGSERISYAGLQIIFAFSLAILDHFGPSSDLTELRDRLVGVLLGVTVSTIVNVFFWPDSIRDTLRKHAEELMEAVRALVTDRVPDRSAADIAQQRLQSWQLLDACQQGLKERLLEPGQNISNRAVFIAMAQRWLDAASLTVRQITQAQWDKTVMDPSIQSQLTGLSEQLNLMTQWPQANQESN